MALKEVDKLIFATGLIEEFTDGRQRLRNQSGSLRVETADTAFLELRMQSRYLPDSKCCEITFAAAIHRTKEVMDAAKMDAFVDEAKQMCGLLKELGRLEYLPTLPELSEFQEHLNQQADIQPSQTGPSMGRTQTF